MQKFQSEARGRGVVEIRSRRAAEQERSTRLHCVKIRVFIRI